MVSIDQKSVKFEHARIHEGMRLITGGSHKGLRSLPRKDCERYLLVKYFVHSRLS